VVFLFYLTHVIALIVICYAIANLLIAIVLNLWGVKEKRRAWRFILRKRWSILLLFLTIFLGHMRQAYFQQYVDWNPYSINQADIVGTWRKNKSEITFNSDNTMCWNREFRRKKLDRSSKYFWHIDKGNRSIIVESESGQIVDSYPVIIFRGHYRILDKYDAEPILITLGFAKVDRCNTN